MIFLFSVMLDVSLLFKPHGQHFYEASVKNQVIMFSFLFLGYCSAISVIFWHNNIAQYESF